MMCEGSFCGNEDVASRVRPGSKAVDVELECTAMFDVMLCSWKEIGYCERL